MINASVGQVAKGVDAEAGGVRERYNRARHNETIWRVDIWAPFLKREAQLFVLRCCRKNTLKIKVYNI
jgi:hypothetical protein